jgi:hypothetical protein
MKRRTVFYLVWVCLLIAWPTLPSARALAAGPPDEIGEYQVAVTPEADGTLLMHYNFSNYCARTDFPSDTQYLEVGVPNGDFTIVDYGPKDWVTGAQARTSDGSWVRLNFARLPKTNDCFNAGFTIRQRAMAYAQGNDVSFQFTPGWFDFATIKKLTITWTLPGNAALVRSLEPQPATTDDSQAVWRTGNLAPNQQYPLSLLIGRAAYPRFTGSPSTTTRSESPIGVGGDSGPLNVATWLVLSALGVVVLIYGANYKHYSTKYGFVGAMGQSLTAGGGLYRYPGRALDLVDHVLLFLGLIVHAFGTVIGDILVASMDGYDSNSTGNRGSSTYRSSSSSRSSCAHSCACARSCACACAGGGRVGCSRKAIGYHTPWLGRRPAPCAP